MEIHLKIPLCLTVKADFSFVSKRGNTIFRHCTKLPDVSKFSIEIWYSLYAIVKINNPKICQKCWKKHQQILFLNFSWEIPIEKKKKNWLPNYHHFSLSSLFHMDHRYFDPSVKLFVFCQTLLLTHILLLGFYPAWDSCRVSVGECRPCRGPVELFLQYVGVCRVNPLVVVLFCVDNVESEVLVKVDGALVVNLENARIWIICKKDIFTTKIYMSKKVYIEYLKPLNLDSPVPLYG